MNLINFYPGPSKIYPQVSEYMQEAAKKGILGANHRSDTFIEISKQSIRALKDKLEIPEEYWVFYTSSATECWEIIAQSLIRERSLHVFNGAFGEKCWQYTQKLKANPEYIQKYSFGLNESIDLAQLKEVYQDDTEVICLTHNETSNATMISQKILAEIRAQFAEALIAVDATSSMGGAFLDFRQADIWYASVQKCLGLPAGMAVLVCSPRAIEQALKIGENKHYNSLTAMIAQMQKWQTTHTPNILNVYLLGRVMQQVAPIKQVAANLERQADFVYALLEGIAEIQPLVENKAVRSQTVLAWQGSQRIIQEMIDKFAKQNIILGKGYGSWKNTSFRLANFPAISAIDIVLLDDFITKIMK